MTHYYFINPKWSDLRILYVIYTVYIYFYWFQQCRPVKHPILEQNVSQVHFEERFYWFNIYS
jgi:hypothetical protein